MATVSIYNSTLNQTFTVTFNLVTNILNGDTGDFTGTNDFYLDVSTTLRITGLSFGHYVVRTLDDVPEGYASATDFTDLCNKWMDYFLEATIFESSSSSSSSSSSGSSDSSNSSSTYYKSSSSTVGKTTSSDSSESSSSSSSTEMKTTSSSSSSEKDPIIVTGNGNMSPNVSGTYSYNGEYSGYSQYKRGDGSYYIWYDSTAEQYTLSAIVGQGGPYGADCFIGVSGTNPHSAYWSYQLWTGTISTSGLSTTIAKVGTNIDGIPDASGNYYLITSNGIDNDPVYVRSDKAYYMYHFLQFDAYAISVDLNRAGPNASGESYFNSITGAVVNGTYLSGAGWSGSLTIADPV